jgi:hypothetical protein
LQTSPALNYNSIGSCRKANKKVRGKDPSEVDNHQTIASLPLICKYHHIIMAHKGKWLCYISLDIKNIKAVRYNLQPKNGFKRVSEILKS